MRSRVIALLTFASVSIPCSSTSNGNGSTASTGDDDARDDADAQESMASAAQATDIERTMLMGVSGTDPNAAATAVAAAQWWPAGCASRTKDASNPAVVHIHLDACSGPFGLRQHTGDLTLTFSKNAAGHLHVEATSANLTINGAAATFSSSRDITQTSGSIDVKGQSAWTRTNASGVTVSYTSNADTLFDLADDCRTTNGSGATMVADREVDSTFTGYTICRRPDGSDACPSGTIAYVNEASGRDVTVTFDGTARATFTGPRGDKLVVALVCGT